MREAIRLKTERTVIQPKSDIRLDLPRYVVCLGDFIVPRDKRQLEGLGGWAGGLRIGTSQTAGAPTMWQTAGMLYRGKFTPLEIIGELVDAGLQQEKEVAENGGMINFLPGVDIAYLTNEEHSRMGIVELTALRGEVFAIGGVADTLNKHFFPDINLWMSGNEKTPFPTLLSDYLTLIRQAKNLNEAVEVTKDELLTAGHNFEIYARDQIERNRQLIQQMRNTNLGGMPVSWQPRTRLFAEQLGITLEDDAVKHDTIVVQSTGVPQPQNETSEWERRRIEAQEEANRIEREKLELMKQNLPKPASVVTDNTIGGQCSFIKADNEQCKNKAVENGRCNSPAHRLNEH